MRQEARNRRQRSVNLLSILVYKLMRGPSEILAALHVHLIPFL